LSWVWQTRIDLPWIDPEFSGHRIISSRDLAAEQGILFIWLLRRLFSSIIWNLFAFWDLFLCLLQFVHSFMQYFHSVIPS
jgi:hypothetical protein